MNKSALSEAINSHHIEELKSDARALREFVACENDGKIIHVLKKMGRLENGSCKDPLQRLLDSPNENIRELAIKNLAKLTDISLLHVFVRYAKEDESTQVRRESVSAIGRLRNRDAIPYLVKMLGDKDPKVVIQAMRGLLVFPNEKIVQSKLKKLINHPNELVQRTIEREENKSKADTPAQKNHTSSPKYMRDVVVHGDVVDTLKSVPDESIHLTFTSPPYYNARDYSIYQSYAAYLQFLEKVFAEVYRVTKEGRFFVLNTSPIIIPRISRAHASMRYPIPYDIHPLLIKMGWEFIDDIVWMKPEASVKNRTAGFLQHRKPLAYKPNAVTEMLMVYRKKTDKLLDWNMRQYDANVVNKSKVRGEYETTNVWKIDPTFDKVHSAVFPLELCHRVIRYYSFVGDLVFDPFGGSGTLGRAAMNMERHFFLTEKEKKYVYRMRDSFAKNDSLFFEKNIRPSFVTSKKFTSVVDKVELK